MPILSIVSSFFVFSFAYNANVPSAVYKFLLPVSHLSLKLI